MSERARFEHELSALGLGLAVAQENPIQRARVGDPLGQRILALLWEEIAAGDVPRIADRLRRLEQVLDAVSDYDAGALLRRLEGSGDLARDFDYRLARATRKRLRDKLRARKKTRPSVPTSQPTVPPSNTNTPSLPVPFPVPFPFPPRPTPPAAPRSWRILPGLVWKSRRRLVKEWGVFDVFLEFEVEVEASVNATDNELTQIKPRWTRGAGPGGEIEQKLKGPFSSAKVEFDGKDGVTVSFQRDFPTAGGYVQISPGLKLSSDVFYVEVEIQKLAPKWKMWGFDFKVQVKPKAILTFRINWYRAIRDWAKRKGKLWIRHILEELARRLGGTIAGALLRKILLGLLGEVLVAVYWDDPPNTPIAASKDDIAGKTRALDWIKSGRIQTSVLGGKTVEEFLVTWASEPRRAFAVGYAHALRQLMTPDWRGAITSISSASAEEFVDLPDISAPAKAWQQWADTQKALRTIGLPSSSQAYRRLRWYEVALMFAAAAYVLGRIKKPEFHSVLKTCMGQVTLAGMSLAVVTVHKRINRGTFLYDDLQGVARSSDGSAEWDAISKLVRDSGMMPDEISERLEPLVLRHLPPL